jgi:hypothetical protein
VTGPTTGLAAARRVADAVLYEGYLLYPYRAGTAKNRIRWQFGVLSPAGALEAGVGEPASLSAEVLLRPTAGATIDVHLRFLQVQARSVEARAGAAYEPVDSLRVSDAVWIPWDEAVPHEIVLGGLRVDAEHTIPLSVGGGQDVELLTDPPAPAGGPVGRLVRTRLPLAAQLTMRSSTVDGWRRLRIELRNLAEWSPDESSRDLAARRALVGTHLLLSGAGHVSLTDPPPEAAGAAARCRNDRWWPALIGDTVLVAPIILPDQAEIAPESPGDLFDATEVDEILTLRVMTLTDEEKAAARGTDPRAAAIIDRCDTMPAQTLERLHGARRETKPWWDPGAEIAPDHVRVDGVQVRKGCRVRLRPTRRADAQDMFLAGQDAVVTAVLSDVDGGTHVAVVLADDPAADLHDWYGRYWYFAPDEIEPLDGPAAGGPVPGGPAPGGPAPGGPAPGGPAPGGPAPGGLVPGGPVPGGLG